MWRPSSLGQTAAAEIEQNFLWWRLRLLAQADFSGLRAHLAAGTALPATGSYRPYWAEQFLCPTALTAHVMYHYQAGFIDVSSPPPQMKRNPSDSRHRLLSFACHCCLLSVRFCSNAMISTEQLSLHRRSLMVCRGN